MQLEGTHGQRLSAYYAQPATPDHDAMILLDLAAHEPAPAPPPASHPDRRADASSGYAGTGRCTSFIASDAPITPHLLA
jgi:hypothetical protein